ncbi:MAG: MBL fold metallo-hydrolase [Aquabacterium sp.]|nr:MAG: MBL fold metallo-hydrolase [Aquabacterium sp.]
MTTFRKIALATVAVLAAALAALAWTFSASDLVPDATDYGPLPAAHPPAGMSLSALPTGRIESKAGFAFRGGSMSEERDFAMTAVLVRHPRGDLMFDTGMSAHLDEHLSSVPWLMRKLSVRHLDKPAAAVLKDNGYDPKQLAGIVPTHAHWDHVGGIADLPGIPVWLNAVEQHFIAEGGFPTELARRVQPFPVRSYAFDDKPYLGFPKSLDLWGDGSIVLVPAPGHTPGSILAFVTLPSGARYVLLGDLVWQTDGITRPAERPWLSRSMVDEDADAVRRAITHVAALHRRFPDLVLLPAHDARAMGKLPVFPEQAR